MKTPTANVVIALCHAASVLVALLLLVPQSTQAAVLLSYNANAGAAATSPIAWGWFPSWDGSGPGTAVTSDTNLGLRAWQLSDTATDGVLNPRYLQSLTPSEIAAALSFGWKMTAVARLVGDFGSGPGFGMQVNLGGKGYYLATDLATNGALQATLLDPAPLTKPLTAAGVGTAAYHTLEFRYSPGQSSVQFWSDGILVDSTPGLAIDAFHEGSIEWGNNGFNQFGIMNFAYVAFEVFTPLTGDFNGSGSVDAGDFISWRDRFGSLVAPYTGGDANGDGQVDTTDYFLWRSNFGARAAGIAVSLGHAVPEPLGLLLLACGTVALGHSGCGMLRPTAR